MSPHITLIDFLIVKRPAIRSSLVNPSQRVRFKIQGRCLAGSESCERCGSRWFSVSMKESAPGVVSRGKTPGILYHISEIEFRSVAAVGQLSYPEI